MTLFKPGGIEALNGVSAERIAEICGVHITTARRYKRRRGIAVLVPAAT